MLNKNKNSKIMDQLSSRYFNWENTHSPMKFLYKVEEDYVESKLNAKSQNNVKRNSVTKPTKSNQEIRLQEQKCDCQLKSKFIDLSNYINGAVGYVNIGQCEGHCRGRPYTDCEESAHTRFKRMLKHVYGYKKVSKEVKLTLNCVPTEFESVSLPMKTGDGGFHIEEFKTLKATRCGCR